MITMNIFTRRLCQTNTNDQTIRLEASRPAGVRTVAWICLSLGLAFSSVRAQSGDWSGTWYGTWNAVSTTDCDTTIYPSGNVWLTLSTAGNRVSGAGIFDGWYCYNSSCELNDLDDGIGTVTGTGSDNTIGIEFNGSIFEGTCLGTALEFPITAANAGATVSGDWGSNGSVQLTKLPEETAHNLQLDVKLNFAKENSDSAKLSAVIDLGPDFSVAGQPLVLYIGGVQFNFALNDKGSAITEQGKVALKYDNATGWWSFSATMMNGSWGSTWAQSGLVNQTTPRTGVPVTLPVIIIVGTQPALGSAPLLYTATAGKSGTARPY
jgi:hypothetical protein